jgi:hypothetical protein
MLLNMVRVVVCFTAFFFWRSVNALAPIHAVVNPAAIATLQHSGMVLAGKLSGAYTEALMKHPLATKMMTGGLLATTGDAIAQSQNQDEPYDKKRAASFMAFDMAYRAVQHKAFPIIVAACQGQYIGKALSALHLSTTQPIVPVEYAATLERTLASQLGIVPLIYYPVFFALTGFMQGLSLDGSVERAKQNFLPLMQRNLLFWIPVQFIQFGFIDEQLQIPFLSAAGLCWTFILSVAAGSARSYTKEAANMHQEDQATSQDDSAAEIYSINSEQAVMQGSTN